MKNFAKAVAMLAAFALAAAVGAMLFGNIFGVLDLCVSPVGHHYLFPDWLMHATNFVMFFGFIAACALGWLAGIAASLASAFKPGRKMEIACSAMIITGLALMSVFVAVIVGGVFSALDMLAGSLIESQPVLTVSATSVIDFIIRYGLWTAAISAAAAIAWEIGSKLVSWRLGSQAGTAA